MRFTNSIAKSAYAVLLTILISIPWGASVGALMSLLNDDHSTKWYHLAAGGAVLAPILAIVFESPVQNLVVLIAKIPFMWVALLPFALLRFIFSAIPAMIADRIASNTHKGRIVSPCPFEGIVRVQSPEKIEVAGKNYSHNDIVFKIRDDWSVMQDDRPWGTITTDGTILPNAENAARLSVSSLAPRIHERRLFVGDKAVGALTHV